MSQRTLWDRVEMAWAMLSGGKRHDVEGARQREARPEPRGDEPKTRQDGFSEEALPWLDAVYSFAMRLTQGDGDDAADLVQETFLRAHRFWGQYERGTNVKSWLFTICRNTFLHRKDLARNRREQPASQMDTELDRIPTAPLFHVRSEDPERSFFQGLIDDEVIAAIDALPHDFKEVLVLSDLGDLRYAEIAQVLDIPIGTVKSRLFRARNILQEKLRDFAARSGYLEETAT
ncbi:MAG: sigma-70 family RNA polymerase sigma factor [Gemmatimonadota bacterium]